MTARPIAPVELLDLAYRSAGRGSGPGRPRTVDLRRAVSTAYYALFRGWTWTVATEVLRDPWDARVADLSRWITHADAADLFKAPLLASGEISRNQAGGSAKHLLPILPSPIHPELLSVCRTFVRLQDARHSADYDDRYDVSRRSALQNVELADVALEILWRLQRAREPDTILLLRLGAGAVKIARTR